MMDNLNAKLLNSQFVTLANSKSLHNSKNDLPILHIQSPFCQAQISLQGAQLIQFKPSGHNEWLWLSPYEAFTAGQAIRGGIPVCLPWFGVNQQDPTKPKHGFVRQENWQLHRIEEQSNQLTLEFHFHYTATQPALYEHSFIAKLSITLSASILYEIQITNTSATEMPLSFALHSYFAVNDCRLTRVSGLENVAYLDNTQQLQRFIQDGAITFTTEVDRVYNGTIQPQTIHAQHSLHIDGNNCPSCIVWNAGEENAKQLADIGDAVFSYICVERGRAFADKLTITANESIVSTMTIRSTV